MFRRSRLKWGLILTLLTSSVAMAQYDVVLIGGRVIDPETSVDAILNVGIQGDTITRITAEPLEGTRRINVNGLVVAPGFIDLHQHTQSDDGYRWMALDGITAALDLEGGVPDIERFIGQRRGRTLIHFGASTSQLSARIMAFGAPLGESQRGPAAGAPLPVGAAANDPATPEQRRTMLAHLERQIEAGALGVGMGIEYSPGATSDEIREVFELADELKVPVFVHARSSGAAGVASVQEVIAASNATGAAAHIVHINSTCMSHAPQCLEMIEQARGKGLDITTEAYPYTVAMTFITSAYFNPGWRTRMGLDYSAIEVPGSGERLTAERFAELRAGTDRLVLIHMNPEQVVDAIIADPLVAIASDGLRLHPRGAGSHARILARYVRERGIIELTEAIRKMSLLPARRLESLMPLAARLGRLQEGAQADIVVFDPERMQDRADFSRPTETSVGVQYLLVAGTIVVNEGEIVDGAAPGRAFVRGLSK